MKKILVGMISFGLLVSGNLFAGTVTVNWATGHSAQGGETIMTTSDGATFNSFCIEFNEHVSIGGTYYYSTSSGAIAGGLTGGSPDPISIGTAWLYANFFNNTLFDNASVQYTSLPTQQDNLQNAIWWLEGEIGAGTGHD